MRVSRGFRVVIPKGIRDALRIRVGTRMHVTHTGGRVTLIPIRDPKDSLGFLSGINTSIRREPDRL